MAPSVPPGNGRHRAASRFYPTSFDERLRRLEKLDPHFAALWSRYTDGLFSRGQLDTRTRLLILVSQYTMRREAAALEETIRASIEERLDLDEVLEATVLCWVYGGEQCVMDGIDAFGSVTERAGLRERIDGKGQAADATTAGRSLDDEMAQWAPEDRDDPRMAALLAEHDWMGISDAVRRRPHSLINNIALLDALDPEFLELWVGVVYGGILARDVLDDRTRCLCIVGACLAMGDTFQYPRHMEAALRVGATPIELLELVFQSCHTIGHPLPLGLAINDLLKLLDDLGRLDEVVADPQKRNMVRKVRDARIAMRRTVGDLRTADVGLDEH